MLFTLKKLIGGLLMPVSVVLSLGLLALLCSWKGKHSWAKSLMCLALVALYLCSIKPIAHLISQPLEYRYSPFDGQDVPYVVVLGGGHTTDMRVASLHQLNRTSLARLLTGVEIVKLQPKATLLVSGYAGFDTQSHAQVAANTAQLLGVDADRILLQANAKDTYEEALAWRNIIGMQPFALVTSAMHMPRAMALFESLGMRPIAAPANIEAKGDRPLVLRDWIPTANNLAIVQAAWHEYLGMSWAWLNKTLKEAV
ncbi:MAG: YdcF family protein [Oleiphilaceae bacterium]|nr:YdcF family protein [Oleiphilaceae bacterium]